MQPLTTHPTNPTSAPSQAHVGLLPRRAVLRASLAAAIGLGTQGWQRLAQAAELAASPAPTKPPLSPRSPLPPLQLAQRYHSGVDVTQYWVSEKLDGVRAYWSGQDGRQLWTRHGQAIRAPQWFLQGLPDEALDGELWLGRGRFDELSALLRRLELDEASQANWRELRYMVFELPLAPGNFTARQARLQALAAEAQPRANAWLQAVAQARVADETALMARLREVLQAGGEGLVLHHAQSLHAVGRSDALLKLTPWLDAEAEVVAHLPGKGRLHGLTGALRLRMPDGKQFNLGSGLDDNLRRNPPALGSRITYRYRELTRHGLPRFAHYLRQRDAMF